VRVHHLIAAGLLWTVGCGGTTVDKESIGVRPLADVPDYAWRELAGKRILFGHQSVGDNIMEGISDLIRAEPKIGLRVIGIEDASSAEESFLAHGKIGKNRFPGLKTDEFARLLEGGLASQVDIAFHKYCFADIDEGTDVAAVFEHYKTVMARLKSEYPRIIFVHVTTPLMLAQSGPKAVVKKILGRQPDHYADNMQRERFNDLMRREYGGREPLFDLAAAESSRPDGGRETISFGGMTSRTLLPSYTTDGGHLNEVGRKHVATELLVSLSDLVAQK